MSGSLIFKFTISLAYRSGKNNYKGCLFAYTCNQSMGEVLAVLR